MTAIDTIFFPMGGVITRHIWEVTSDLLDLDRPRDRMALLDLEKALYRGAIGAVDYCHKAVEQAQTNVTSGRLVDLIPAHMELMPGILPVIDELAARHRLHLVADYPLPWRDTLLERLALAEYFPSVITAPDHELDDYFKSIFNSLIISDTLDPARSLWIDNNPLRTRAAIRRGVFAALFVGALRLRRDLALWDLIP